MPKGIQELVVFGLQKFSSSDISKNARVLAVGLLCQAPNFTASKARGYIRFGGGTTEQRVPADI